MSPRTKGLRANPNPQRKCETNTTLSPDLGGDNLPFRGKPMEDFCGQISCCPKLRNILLCDRRSHPPALTAGSEHDWGWWRWEPEGWNLGWLGLRKKQAQTKKTSLGPYIKTPNTKCIHLGLETYLSPESCTQGTVGLPMLALMRIP